MLAAHFAVEPLHPKLFPTRRPHRELSPRRQKTAVLAQHQFDAHLVEMCARLLQLVDHVLLATLCGDDTRSAKLNCRRAQPFGIRLSPPVRDPVALSLKRVGEVAHGR